MRDVLLRYRGAMFGVLWIFLSPLPTLGLRAAPTPRLAAFSIRHVRPAGAGGRRKERQRATAGASTTTRAATCGSNSRNRSSKSASGWYATTTAQTEGGSAGIAFLQRPAGGRRVAHRAGVPGAEFTADLFPGGSCRRAQPPLDPRQARQHFYEFRAIADQPARPPRRTKSAWAGTSPAATGNGSRYRLDQSS